MRKPVQERRECGLRISVALFTATVESGESLSHKPTLCKRVAKEKHSTRFAARKYEKRNADAGAHTDSTIPKKLEKRGAFDSGKDGGRRRFIPRPRRGKKSP